MRSNRFFIYLTLLVSIFVLSLNSAMTFANTTKLSAQVEQALKQDQSLVPVIVQAKNGLTKGLENQVITKGGKLKRELGIIKGFSAELPNIAIQELAFDSQVVRIAYDTGVQAQLDVAVPTVGASVYWNMGYTGKGVTVAVIDSGIYPHPDLIQPTNRIVAFKDLINFRTSTYDDNGHGTHVAGIIAGNGIMSQGKYKGVAPEANLIGVKVLDNLGGGRQSDVIAGIQWVVQNKNVYGVDVINLSLGAVTTESWNTDPLSQAAQAAWDRGIVVVAAAGNDGPSMGTIRTPGINPNIITVGATDDRGTSDPADDTIAPFSSRGPTIDGFAKPDVLAPGVGITSLMADTTYLPKKKDGLVGTPVSLSLAKGRPTQTTNQYYISMSGTSMATSIQSGLAALLLNQEPIRTPKEIKNYLLKTTKGGI